MNSKHKVLLYERMHSEGTRLLEEKCQVIYAETLQQEKLIEQARDVHGIIVRANGLVTKNIMEAAPNLRVIGRHGVGLDNIDLKAAKERGIRVVYAPTANAESVAEHFVALALMLAKKIRISDMALRRGEWHVRYEYIGEELNGKTLGIVGFGRIGQRTAQICHHGFGMVVLFYDVIDYPEAQEAVQAKRVDLQRLFRESDFISINLPLSAQTRGYVNADLLKLMKPTAFLINVARGPIWNEADVVQALRENWIAGVGSDVYEEEPTPADNPLLALDNFVGTPHMAAHTEEGLIRMSLVARDIIAVLEGREPEFPIPEALYG